VAAVKISLDTCGYSGLALHRSEVVRCVEEAEAVYLPGIVLGELCAGFCLGRREKENRRELAEFLDLPGVEVVNIDASIADRYGILVKTLRKQGTPIPTNDIWIAAAALETGSRLVTFDAHFGRIPGLLMVAL
jgi:tRNA(fMet)-specific endonuclease VapC